VAKIITTKGELIMLLQPLMDNLTQLHLPAFRKGIEEQITNPKYSELSFEERLSILVDLELLQRDNSRLNRYLKKAHFHLDAALEDFDFSPARGVDKHQILELSQVGWITKKLNVIISGPTGAGKTFLSCALGHASCRKDFSVRYFRTPRFLQDLRLAHADGSYPKLLATLVRFDLIIFDDWMRDALSLVQSQDLLDILDDRYGRSSTMVVTQIPIDAWHERIPDPTLADAILDRLVNNAYRLQLSGESQRRLRSSSLMAAT
jgi:DNA replication protein DnaC